MIMILLDFIVCIMSTLCSLLYVVYDMLLLGGIFILFPFESYDSKINLHKICVSKCNNCCTDICYNISWKSCEIITVAHYYYKTTVLPKFHSITDNYFRDRNEVILIKNGEEITTFKTWELFELEKENVDYELLLYTKYNDIEHKKNYTLIGDHCFKNPIELLNQKCDVNFIIFQLTTNNNKYDINLKEPYNFFIKDNVLKYSFFKWYIKRVYDVNLTDDFCVNYMTQDMSIATLHNPFFIKFNEDGITSFSSGKPKPTNSNVIVKNNVEENDSLDDSVEESSDESVDSSIDKEEYVDENTLYGSVVICE